MGFLTNPDRFVEERAGFTERLGSYILEPEFPPLFGARIILRNS